MTAPFISIPGGSNTFLVNSGSVTPTFQVDRAGDYVVRLIVSDGLESSDPDTVTVSVGNSAPIAVAELYQDQSGDYITLDGTNSIDADNDPLTYRWNMLSRPAGSEAVLFYPYTAYPFFWRDVAGDYLVQLIVNDGSADSSPDTLIITTANRPPVAVPRLTSVGELYTGDTVTLTGDYSYDRDNDSLTYRWTFIDRPEGSNALLEAADTMTPSFVIDKQGDYIAQLVVNDGQVDSQPATVLIQGIHTCIDNLAIRPKSTKIQLTWTYNPDTEYVEIERGPSMDGPWDVIAQTDSTYATYLDEGLVNGTTYYYRLRGRFEGESVVECYQYPDSNPVCNQQPCSWMGDNYYDCGGQQCQVISYDFENWSLIMQCGGTPAAATSCPPGDYYCQWMCECGPDCLPTNEGGEVFGDFDFSICDPPVNELETCSTQVIASQPVGRVRVTWVPDLSGMSIEQAQAALTAAQLALGQVCFERTTAVPADQVIRQDVPRDSALPTGSTIDIILSTRGVTE